MPGRPAAPERPDVDPVTAARLWENPCWFAFRFNYLALSYNLPLYGWVEERYGLPRPEYVVIYSLGLRDGVTARDIAISYGFPKTSLSRAVNAVERKGLVARTRHPSDRRSRLLHLTPAGRALFDETLPRFVAGQEALLRGLSPGECETLSVLMAKVVLGTFDAPADPAGADEGPRSRAPADRPAAAA